MSISSPRSRRAAACSPNCAPSCPGPNTSRQVWRLRDRDERGASLALRDGHGNRLRKAVGWYRTHGRLHTGDQIAMAADAHDAYLSDRAAGKDALLICDTTEMADALNHRLHHALTVEGPAVRADRDQRNPQGRHHHQPPQRRHR